MERNVGAQRGVEKIIFTICTLFVFFADAVCIYTVDSMISILFKKKRRKEEEMKREAAVKT